MTCRRKGTRFLADISNGLKERKMYLRGAKGKMRPRLTCQEVSQTLRRTLAHSVETADSPPSSPWYLQRAKRWLGQEPDKATTTKWSTNAWLKQSYTKLDTAPCITWKSTTCIS